ncbi:MAG: hypothetical protein HY289_14260 [Planctomycetes bacterium]|nr:hypothetical protein [Planctomycetota bacterium]
MAIHWSCPHCKTALAAPDTAAGQSAMCYKCHKDIGVIPSPQAPASAKEPAEAVIFSCSSCAKKLKIKPELAGKRVKCPGCGVIVSAPTAEMPPPPIAVAQASPAPPPKRKVKTPEDSIREAHTMSDLQILEVAGLKNTAIRDCWGPKMMAFMAEPQRQIYIQRLEVLGRVYYGQMTQEQADKETKEFKPTLRVAQPSRVSD